DDILIYLDDNRLDGQISNDKQIMGTYLHGIFESAQSCQYLLQWAGLSNAKASNYQQNREIAINLIADTLERNLDMDAIIKQIIE
ncbi:MAG: cobyric acid synthase CobQ, partial [Pseudomonadota bacterium]